MAVAPKQEVRNMYLEVDTVESQEGSCSNQNARGTRYKVAAVALVLFAGVFAFAAFAGGASKELPTASASSMEEPEVKLELEPEQEDEPSWYNKEPEYLKLVEEAKKRGGQGAHGTPEERRLQSDPLTCMARSNRFDKIDAMKAGPTFAQGADPYFPASETSIAPAGADCGDSAAGIHKPCSTYNHWGNMFDISRVTGSTFTVFDAATGMPAPADMKQGQMGTCYFLSALVSIAHAAPSVIKDMFVRQELWSKGIITTKWLVNGRESLIEVDTTIPAVNNKPYFVTAASSRAWWPAILEKTWAKIFSSYKAAEAGIWANAVAAITRAPVETILHQGTGTKAKVWAVLLQGTAKKWPMGAGTSSSHYGLAAGHAYAVLAGRVDPTYGNVVDCMNPWGSDYYQGSIPNPTKGDGMFTMTFDEYYAAFSTTGVGKVMAGHKVTSVKLSTSLQASYKFATTSNQPFSVSVVWPSARMLKPCAAKNPTFMINLVKFGVDTAFPVARNTVAGGNDAHVTVPDASLDPTTPGTYRVAVSINFPMFQYGNTAYLNIYAAEAVDLYPPTVDNNVGFPQIALGMVGANVGGSPCTYVTMGPHGLWKADYTKTIGGVATYWKMDGSAFGYYVGSLGQWWLIGKAYFDQVKAGGKWSWTSNGKLSKTDMTCGCTDSAAGVTQFTPAIPCNKVGYPTFIYNNVRCDQQVEYTSLVQAACPKTCKVAACTEALPSPLPDVPAPAPAPVASSPAGAVHIH